MLDKIYILNYYVFDAKAFKILGSESNACGYFTSKELAMQELTKEINRHPNEKLEKYPWWYILIDRNEERHLHHTYEIFEITLNKSAFENSISNRINLEELA